MIVTALELAKRFEGFSPVPYLCPAGYWTIGYGHLCAVDHPPITREEGEVLLQLDLHSAYAATIAACPILLCTLPTRLEAIVDFTFNLGAGRLRASTLRRKINVGDWESAKVELGKWVWGGGRKLPGLVLRREAEALLL